MFTMDGDLKPSPPETRPLSAAEKTPHELLRGGSTDNTPEIQAPRAPVANLRRWWVRLWCVVGALCVGYLFSYLVSDKGHQLRYFLFVVVTIGLAIAACGLVQIDRDRDM
jgi:hypothetical protein